LTAEGQRRIFGAVSGTEDREAAAFLPCEGASAWLGPDPMSLFFASAGQKQ